VVKKIEKMVSKTIVVVGKSMAKIDARTSCPWINYQPKAPKATEQYRMK